MSLDIKIENTQYNPEDDEFWNDIKFDNPKGKQRNSNSTEKYSLNYRESNVSSIKQKEPKKFILSSSLMEKIQNNKEKKRLKIEKEIKDKKEKQKKIEKKECTFKPKINKTLPSYIFDNNQINLNDNTYNYNNYNIKRRCNSVEKKSFYDRNIQWLNNLKGKNARIKQLNDLNSCDFSYKPSITEIYNRDEIFNNEKILKYWMKNNKSYLTRRLLTLNGINKNFENNQIKNGIDCNDINNFDKNRKNNLLSFPNININNSAYINETINYLHKELQNTANDETENLEGKILTYD